MKDKLLKIINHYGVMKQLKYIHSEYFELDEAIIKRTYLPEEADDDYFAMSMEIEQAQEHIAEEIADVLVMLKQFQLYFGISTDDIKEIAKHKVDRQIERIENE